MHNRDSRNPEAQAAEKYEHMKSLPLMAEFQNMCRPYSLYAQRCAVHAIRYRLPGSGPSLR